MRRTILSLGVLAAIGSIAVPVTGQDPVRAPVALTSLQLGQWEIRSRADPSVNRTVCLGDPRSLIQLRHTGAACKRYIISDDPRATTVHYSCPVGGHGQTTIRVETPRLIQLESQGVANRAPFAFTAEGRRVGNCSAAGAGGSLGN